MNKEEALRSALREIADMTYDSWSNGHKAGEIARAALERPQTQQGEADSDLRLSVANLEDMVRRHACGDRSEQAVEKARDRVLALSAPHQGTEHPVGMTDEQISDAYHQAQWDWGGKGDRDAFFLCFGRRIAALAATPSRAPDSEEFGNQKFNEGRQFEAERMASRAPASVQDERYCNKCGYFGPDALHDRPNGTGQCGYLSIAPLPAKAAPATPDTAALVNASGYWDQAEPGETVLDYIGRIAPKAAPAAVSEPTSAKPAAGERVAFIMGWDQARIYEGLSGSVDSDRAMVERMPDHFLAAAPAPDSQGAPKQHFCEKPVACRAQVTVWGATCDCDGKIACTRHPETVHPSDGAQAAGQEDARDAARYRLARSYEGNRVALFTIDSEGSPLDILIGGHADNEIDAALAQSPASGAAS